MTAHAHGTILTHACAPRALDTPLRTAAVFLAAVVTALAAQFTIPNPMSDVPFVLTPLAVLLTGAALGPRLGASAQALYLAAGAAGLPVFAADPRLPLGALRLVGPTAGYLWAYPVAAFVAGWLAERGWDRSYLRSVAAMAAGLAVIYAGGLAWRVSLLGSWEATLVTSVVPYVIPDIIKIAAAALVLPQAWKLVRPHRT
jgi:biotin transport system substrate-specific component